MSKGRVFREGAHLIQKHNVIEFDNGHFLSYTSKQVLILSYMLLRILD